ncbi:hypothetical protein [Sphingomonas natans]|uniref:hypothetical protein n=1 Tax=Sphingomonas natans TaxID=3063330 RepID=UPI0026E2F33B|nr:hypothetical protein [Sphingomonas sp. BIUV-7]
MLNWQLRPSIARRRIAVEIFDPAAAASPSAATDDLAVLRDPGAATAVLPAVGCDRQSEPSVANRCRGLSFSARPRRSLLRIDQTIVAHTVLL